MFSKMDDKPQKKYYIKNTPDGKGAGMFAKEEIKRGDLILSEEPFLKIKSREPIEIIKIIKQSLNPEQKTKLGSLCSSRDTSGMIPEDRFFCIITTNFVSLKDDRVYESGVFEDFSRVNHSCRPNSNHFWNTYLNQEQLWCQKDIQKDEEIEISYMELYADRKSRQTHLKMVYNFDCRCIACSLTGIELSQSDKRRRNLAELDEQILSLASLRRIDTALGMVENLLKILQEELPFEFCYVARASYDAFNLIYMGNRNKYQLKKWAKIWCESIKISQGGMCSNLLADVVRSYLE